MSNGIWVFAEHHKGELDGTTLERLTDHVADADSASARGDLAAYAEANRRFHLELRSHDPVPG